TVVQLARTTMSSFVLQSPITLHVVVNADGSITFTGPAPFITVSGTAVNGCGLDAKTNTTLDGRAVQIRVEGDWKAGTDGKISLGYVADFGGNDAVIYNLKQQ